MARIRWLSLLACLAAGIAEAQTISVSPRTATVAVGSTKQLTRSSTATWSSSDTSIATVSSVGLVKAKRPGQALICVTAGGPSACAIITVPSVVVVAPPPPPPPPEPPPVPAPVGAWRSHEPAGMSLLVDRPFNSLGESSGWGNSGQTIASDATGPQSPPGVLRATYPKGFAGGSGPGYAETSHDGVRVLYVTYWAKLSSNFWGHLTGINKQFYEWADQKPIFYFDANGGGDGSLSPHIVLQNTPADAVLKPNLDSLTKIPRGKWYNVEILLTGNTSGAANGSADWWIDGVHVGSRTGVRFTSGTTQWNIFTFRPIWGGAGDVVPATMTLDLDHLYMSGKN